jgi:protein-disulfide isomerase
MAKRSSRSASTEVSIQLPTGALLVGGAVILLLVLLVVGVFVWQRSQVAPVAAPAPVVAANVTPEGFPVKGSPTAPVTVIEYSDFQCPNCRRFFEETLSAFEPYIQAGLVRLVYADFPIRGEESLLAAQAGRCALEQNAFWEYHDLLFQRQAGVNSGTFSRENLKAYAAELGLDVEAFSRCLDSGKYEKAVLQALEQAKALGLKGTPSFVIIDPIAGQRPPITGDPSAPRWQDLFDRYASDLGWPLR